MNLSDERKELFDKANKEADSSEERASIVAIFTYIHFQDKEFIKRCVKRFKSINDSMAEMIIKEEAGEKLCVNSEKGGKKNGK